MRSVFILLLSAAVVAGCDDPPGSEKPEQRPAPGAEAPQPSNLLERSQAGKRAPATAFLDAKGGRTTLAKFRGKPLLLNLWATWCAPCLAEMPQLDTLAGREKALQVVTVSQDRGEDGKQLVQAFFAKKRFAHLQPYRDPENAFSDAFSIQSLPTTILFDSAGKEVWRLIGPEDWTGQKAAVLLDEAD